MIIAIALLELFIGLLIVMITAHVQWILVIIIMDANGKL
jgi:hypothetical protein